MRRWTLSVYSGYGALLLWRHFTGRVVVPPEHLHSKDEPSFISPSLRSAWYNDRETTTTTNKTTATPSSATATTTVVELPPWPVDDIEFNTRAPNGGHDIRRAQEKESAFYSTPEECNVSNPGSSTSLLESGLLLQPRPLTADQLSSLRQVELTEEGSAAVSSGGWVCGVCLQCMPHRSRSVCDHCYTVRHDAAAAVSRWRENPLTWFCSKCCEFNFDRDVVCRCCGVQRSVEVELRVVHHERVPAEIQRAAVGSVIVTRNRVSRWRCGGCAESNALQSSQCKSCHRERFDFSVICPSCKSSQQLSNAQMYGSEPTDRVHTTRIFGLHNCFPRLAPELRCGACRASLHGATASTRSDAWLCACGQVSNAAVVSCTRCRLPRRVAQNKTLEELLRVWDFAHTTNWYCEGCEHVNKASRHVVALERQGGTLTTTTTSTHGNGNENNSKKKETALKVARIVHGQSSCESCGLQWHHQSVNNGQHWRCACHKVNRCSDVRCQVCQLPAVDGIRSDVLSFWSRGDWYCLKCHRQNYREKVVCTCGETRPKE
ncbi:uncharacterized protein TM35_000122410 [Trypanosoma theileri]|uniref:RanBP2-type domain-containing protein n=1 Tax=Trypanosoma theileri TaxID=67003 RepID=A0A1X0NXN9_9TRYP|nr:uncharacterized protein TM35_000122410 [Trypanosoma theileri]ORC89466.1 hypothetical protein TM35_000122410 [Trypanosoma theileri]